jgi:UDP-N-acetylglucosamine 2-epimerase
VEEGETPPGYVLFIAGYINHVKTFLPVLHQLPKKYLVLASGPDTCDFLRQQRVAYRRLGHFVTSSMWQHYKAEGWRLRKRLQVLVADEKQKMQYDNIPLLPFLQTDLSRLLRNHLARLQLYTDVYLELFQRSRPSRVVVADDTTTHGRTAVLAAQSLNIPTLNIQHGAIADVHHYRYAIADVFAAWGEHDRELLIRNGVPEQKIVVTGQPRFDDFSQRHDDILHTRKRLGIPGSHKLLLWATTPFVPRVSYDFPERNLRYLEAFAELLAREQNWALIIKLHPRDQRTGYETALAKMEKYVRSRVKILQDEDIQQLLPIADVLLAWNTSVIQEAVLAGKPIIGINFFGFPEAIPSVSEEVALPARAASELSHALCNVLAGDKSILSAMAAARKKYAARYLNAGDRAAVARIVELLDSEVPLGEISKSEG